MSPDSVKVMSSSTRFALIITVAGKAYYMFSWEYYYRCLQCSPLAYSKLLHTCHV